MGRTEDLLGELQEAIRSAPRRVQEIEVGTELSIALGRLRASVSCGGCETPLSYEGVPARTVVGLKVPFRLVLDESAPRAAGSASTR
jgi:hypothetical protein